MNYLRCSLILTTVMSAFALAAHGDEPAIRPGTTVVVTEENAELRAGSETVVKLPKGSKFRVIRLKSPWLAGSVTIEGRKYSGWLRESQVSLKSTGSNPNGADINATAMTVGPWQVAVTSFRTQSKFETKVAGETRTLTAKDDAMIGVVAIKCKVLRAYTKEEEALIAKHSGAESINAGRRLFGNDPILFSPSFMLAYAKDVAGQKKFVFSTCQLMDCPAGFRTLALNDAIFGYSSLASPQSEATLAFEYHEDDRAPLLIFTPIPGGKEMFAARISVKPDDEIAVEYGSLEQMKKYIPKELRQTQAGTSVSDPSKKPENEVAQNTRTEPKSHSNRPKSIAAEPGEITTFVTRTVIGQEGGSYRIYPGSFVVFLDGMSLVDYPGSLLFIAEGGLTIRGEKLKESGLYLFDKEKEPTLTGENEYSVWISLEEDVKIHAKQDGTGQILGTVTAGERIRLLFAGSDPKGWHKIRDGNNGKIEGWVNGETWSKTYFIKGEISTSSATAAKSRSIAPAKILDFLKTSGQFGQQFELVRSSAPDAPRKITRLKRGVPLAAFQEKFGKPNKVEDDASGFISVHSKGRHLHYGLVVVFVNDDAIEEFAEMGPIVAEPAKRIPAATRTWTDNTGEHKVQATFLKIEGDKVFLKKADGTEIELPLRRLGSSDRDIARQLQQQVKPK